MLLGGTVLTVGSGDSTSDIDGLMARVRSQWKASIKGEVEVNEACWKCLAKCHLGSASASPTGTSYRVVTYHHST
jgi:hypothetical protein